MVNDAFAMFFGGDFPNRPKLFEAVHLVKCHQVDFRLGLCEDIILHATLGLFELYHALIPRETIAETRPHFLQGRSGVLRLLSLQTLHNWRIELRLRKARV